MLNFVPSILITRQHCNMGGFFGTIARGSCSTDLFYGTDYNSHLGTRRCGMATYDQEQDTIFRSIHNLENAYFRNKFEDELPKFKGTAGIGVISDTSFLCRYFKQHTGQTPQQFRISQAEHPLL